MSQIILDSANDLIQGDFDNATLNNRTRLQTTTTNATSNVYVIPNGSATSAGVSISNNSNLTNASKIVMATNGSTDTQIISGVNGSGTYLPLSFYTNNALAMQVATSGNVGIGTSSPTEKLDVNGYIGVGTSTASPGGGGNIRYRDDAATARYAVGILGGAGDRNWSIFDFIASAIRMTIDSSGHVYVGTTTFVPGEGNTATGAMIANTGKAFFSNGSDSAINANRNNDGGLIICRRSGNLVGSISVTSSATAYNTSSDYRLKENIVSMTGALDKVLQLNPVNWTWKLDGSNGQGFIAHELAEVCPDAVSGEKDAVDAEGKPIYQGVDTSFLVATLTKAIQEQQAIINELKTRIEALESK